MQDGLKHFLVLGLFLLISQPAWANCIRVTSTSSLSSMAIAAGYTAADWTGACDTCHGNIGLPAVININSGTNFQPSGTLLASAVGNFLTAATNKTYTSKQILFRCTLSDAGSLYEMYATNGDNAYTGMYASAEIEGAYYDVAKNVAVRMTNLSTGEYYSRYWKQRQITSADWYQDGTYIYIPASAFSNVLYEMYKIHPLPIILTPAITIKMPIPNREVILLLKVLGWHQIPSWWARIARLIIMAGMQTGPVHGVPIMP